MPVKRITYKVKGDCKESRAVFEKDGKSIAVRMSLDELNFKLVDLRTNEDLVSESCKSSHETKIKIKCALANLGIEFDKESRSKKVKEANESN